MILAPTWYDPCRDRLCSFEEAVDQLEAETRAFREDRAGYVAFGMRAWKRGRLQEVFGRETPLLFAKSAGQAQRRAGETGRKILVWAGKEPAELAAPGLALRVEDGFLRSRGLGANLVPPFSLVTDDLGIYYDPNRESRLERLILAPLPPGGRVRAEALLARINAGEDFAKLARENSEDANTRAEGGDLGYFGRDLLPKPIEEVVFAMNVGQVRGPVRADKGFHIIKLADKRNKDVKSLDESKNEIRMQLRQKEYEKQAKTFVADLRRKAMVDLRL
jgi:capsular polysaccharide export protein